MICKERKGTGRRVAIAVFAALIVLSQQAPVVADQAGQATSTQAGDSIFAQKLEEVLVNDVPEFAKTFNAKQRKQLVTKQIETAKGVGLTTEQGIASYVLGVLYVGPGFQKKSKELEKLLKSRLPEVRKAHAMNEWVNAMVGAPDNVAAADQKLKEALKLTKPWGE